MRLHALLAFYDEDPSWLAATVASLTNAHVDHLVAVDGVYLLYPGALRKHRSTQNQLEAVLSTAYGAGLATTLHIPQAPYGGNEVEKRNLMFNLARPTAQPDDWFLIIDADEFISMATHDFKQQLQAASEDVAYYKLNDGDTPNHVRGLYRNTPGLHIKATHYGYHNTTRYLWDGHGEPAADLTPYLVLEHRQRDPNSPRNKAKWEYYRTRDQMKAEAPI